MRAARALIGWTAQQLADASGVGVATIRRAELRPNEVGMTGPNLSAVERAFYEAGVEFIPENGGGAGVRLKKAEA